MKIELSDINDRLDAIPNVLYRGIVIDYETLKNYHFSGVQLTPPYEPLIDNQGRKVVGDGNEYGVYMTDNLKVAKDYYANSSNKSKNNSLIKDLEINHQILSIPSVGIVYTINTRGLEVRRPFITPGLTSHYNNGIVGHEFISDSIPPENYTVSQIMIGRDFLHDEELIECSNILLAEKQTREKVEIRKYRLELFVNELSAISLEKIKHFTEKEQIIFRDIFGENGAKFILERDVDFSQSKGIIQYLINKFYNGHLSKTDWDSLAYIEELKSKLYKTQYPQNTDNILEILSNEIAENYARRKSFIERKKNNGEIANTRSFDIRTMRMNKIYNIILACQELTKSNRQDNDRSIESNQISSENTNIPGKAR